MKTKTQKETSLKLIDLYQQSQSEKDAQDIPFMVKEAEQQLSSDILATEKSLSSKERELNKAYYTLPFNSVSIIELENEIEGLKAGLEKLNSLKERLF